MLLKLTLFLKNILVERNPPSEASPSENEQSTLPLLCMPTIPAVQLFSGNLLEKVHKILHSLF